MLKRLVLLFCCLASSLLAASQIYLVDDGTAEAGYLIGLGDPIEEVYITLNGFQAVPNGLTIDAVQISFYPVPSGSDISGLPLTIYVWTDPDNDGDPTNAVVASSAAGVVSGYAPNTFYSFPVPPVTLAPGDWFFAGVSSPSAVVGYDTTLPSHQSWYVIFDSVADPNNLSSAPFFQNMDYALSAGDWTIRAASTEDVPEPASIILVTLGVAGIAALRRGRVKADR